MDAVKHCGEEGCLYHIVIYRSIEECIYLPSKIVLKNIMQAKLKKYQATRYSDHGSIWPGAYDTASKEYGGFWELVYT